MPVYPRLKSLRSLALQNVINNVDTFWSVPYLRGRYFNLFLIPSSVSILTFNNFRLERCPFEIRGRSVWYAYLWNVPWYISSNCRQKDSEETSHLPPCESRKFLIQFFTSIFRHFTQKFSSYFSSIWSH